MGLVCGLCVVGLIGVCGVWCVVCGWFISGVCFVCVGLVYLSLGGLLKSFVVCCVPTFRSS